MSAPAGQRVQREYVCRVTGDARIVSLYGHYHAHGRRFGVWLQRASGAPLRMVCLVIYARQPTTGGRQQADVSPDT